MSDIQETLNTQSALTVGAIMAPMLEEILTLKGRYHAICYDKDGNIKWEDPFNNLVVTVGKNFILDTVLAGSAYTVTGPFLGLISSVSFSAVAAGDTMASHGGWLESGGANAPTMSSTRGTMAFSAASAGSKATSAAVSFSISGPGTLEGAFVVLGTGAVSTVGSTAGTLLSAGTFAATRGVAGGDTVNVSYSLAV